MKLADTSQMISGSCCFFNGFKIKSASITKPYARILAV